MGVLAYKSMGWHGQTPVLGAHISIAGGVDKAIERGMSLGCNVIQLFTKNSNQWRGRPLRSDEIERFHALRKGSGISRLLAHDSYLINLASSDAGLRERSVRALIGEMDRCRTLNIPCIVLHPGSHPGVGEDKGIANIIDSLNIILDETHGWHIDIALENTAGQGSSIGYRLEHLRWIIEGARYKERIKVCLDSCHLLAAGYDIRTYEGYHEVMEEFDKLLGFERLACFHVNDSKKGPGSRVDRHEHIGKGCVGIEFFKSLMTDKRLGNVAKIIETPRERGLEDDRVNLKILRELSYFL